MSQSADANALASKGQATADPYSIPLDAIDVSDSEPLRHAVGIFRAPAQGGPVAYCAESEFGPYWSVTRFDDIVHVEKHDELFSSARHVRRRRPGSGFSARGRLPSRWTSTRPTARSRSRWRRRATWSSR